MTSRIIGGFVDMEGELVFGGVFIPAQVDLSPPEG